VDPWSALEHWKDVPGKVRPRARIPRSSTAGVAFQGQGGGRGVRLEALLCVSCDASL